jgi:triose/dihydroxyacetone kinase / FAD-AMP lyase (cyclizing)
VTDSLRGLCVSNLNLALDVENKGKIYSCLLTFDPAFYLMGLRPLLRKVIHVASQDRTKVALVCGGGSGHEPAHAGFVGSYI